MFFIILPYSTKCKKNRSPNVDTNSSLPANYGRFSIIIIQLEDTINEKRYFMVVFRIKDIRKSKNITAYKLSKIANISKNYLSELENNKRTNVTLDVLIKIANALEVNVKYLFYTFNDIEDLKQEMYKRIGTYGINSKEVLEISQLIDLLINIKMKGLDK